MPRLSSWNTPVVSPEPSRSKVLDHRAEGIKVDLVSLGSDVPTAFARWSVGQTQEFIFSIPGGSTPVGDLRTGLSDFTLFALWSGN